jgi:hypothetical protein
MTDLLSAVLGVSFAAGLNTYATVLALGIFQRLGIVQFPAGIDVVGTWPVMVLAGTLFVVEFFADKVPVVDSLWDVVHTVVRPAAGALLACGIVGNVDPQWQVIAALTGGRIALTSHTAKASTRAAVNVSPEPFSNWALSISEDVLAISLVWFATTHPVIAIILALLLILIAGLLIWKLSRFAARIFRRAV